MVCRTHRKAVAPRRASLNQRTEGCNNDLHQQPQQRSETLRLAQNRRPDPRLHCPLLYKNFRDRTLEGIQRSHLLAQAITFSTASAISFMSRSQSVGWTRNIIALSPSSLATGSLVGGRRSAGKARSRYISLQLPA